MYYKPNPSIVKQLPVVTELKILSKNGIPNYYNNCYISLKSDSHVPENFCQIKIFPSHVRKNTMICLLGV